MMKQPKVSRDIRTISTKGRQIQYVLVRLSICSQANRVATGYELRMDLLSGLKNSRSN